MGADGLKISNINNEMRFDVALVKRGLVESRERAKHHILAGDVCLNGQIIKKPSTIVFSSDVIKLDEKAALRYVGRGGLKLEKAIRIGGYDLSKVHALDIGASTGGFTDCMLQHGAALVYAVDVGHGQLHPKLTSDSRVINLEGVDIRNFDKLSNIIPLNSVDFCSIDVSFISVKKIFNSILPFLKKNANVVCLIKPQFEAGREYIGKNGLVKSPDVHKNVIDNTMSYFASHGVGALSLTYSPITGGEGNIEYLVLLQQGLPLSNSICVNDVVKEAHKVFK
jgi:23S rRNA (cytidine1920-2'-O)/16S rRNA (cytidine1409-2'-O)-methyltransferase